MTGSIFDRPIADLAPWQRGDPITADRLNAGEEGQRRRDSGVPLPRQVRRVSPKPTAELYGIVQDDVGCIDGSDDCDVASGTGLTVDGVTVGCTDVVIRYAVLDADGAPEEIGTADVIAKAVYLYGSTTPTNLCDCEPYLKAGHFVPLTFINGQLCVDIEFRSRVGAAGIQLAIIITGPHVTYFTVKLAYWDSDGGAAVARTGATTVNAYVPCLYHTVTLDDDAPDYTQPRLTTGDAVWVTQDYPGGTWLVVGHFQASTTECP